MSPQVSVVIPTLNEAGNIGRVIKGVRHVLAGYDYEIIVVDTNSTDGTPQIASKLGARVISGPKGKGASLLKGLHAAKGEILISMDADLSNEPKELLLLIAGIKAGYDICMGSRFLTGGGSLDMPFIRIVGNKFFIAMVDLLFDAHYSDLCYGYRSFRRGTLEKLHLQEKGFGIEADISIKAIKKHLKVIEVPSWEKERRTGDAKLRTFGDGFNILKTILKNLVA